MFTFYSVVFIFAFIRQKLLKTELGSVSNHLYRRKMRGEIEEFNSKVRVLERILVSKLRNILDERSALMLSGLFCGKKRNHGDISVIKSPNPIDVHVGSRVRLRRMMLKMSQEQLGEHLGVTFQQVQKYEKGMNRISASRLQHIARLLTVPVGSFFEDAPGSAPATIHGETSDGTTHASFGFLLTSEGVRLNRAFGKIGDSLVRRKVIELVCALADEQDMALVDKI